MTRVVRLDEQVRNWDAQWTDSPPLPAPGGEVHVWRARLTASATRVSRMARTLSSDERARAERFRRDGDRRRFVIGRGFLRAVLGTYLHRAPSSLTFGYGPAAKPRLLDDNEPDLRFNASRSGDLALIAVTRHRGVGVDIEAVRPIADLHEVAGAVLLAGERSAWRALPPHVRGEAFLRAWTRKEAFLKGTGTGLSLEPQRVEVSLAPIGTSLLIEVEGDPAATRRWTVRDLDVGAGYVGALGTQTVVCPAGFEPSTKRW